MINIPFEHQGCAELREELFRPTEGFVQRVEEATGKQVSTHGGGTLRDATQPPPYVGFVGGGTAPEDVVEVAWTEAVAAREAYEQSIRSMIEKCPGIMSTGVRLGTDPIIGRQCGLLALREQSGETQED